MSTPGSPSARAGVVGVVDAVADLLRRGVFAGELAPGQAVTEAWVSQRHEVARPSAKAAIEKLVGEGLLERTAHRSARVPVLDAASVHDIYQTRRRLESEALRQLAAERRVPEAAMRANDEVRAAGGGSSVQIVDPDMRFHTALVEGIGSERTARAYRALVAEVRLCMAQVQGRELLSIQTIHAQHTAITERVAAGDAAGAVALLTEHLGRAEELLISALERRA